MSQGIGCSHSAALTIFAHHNLGPTDQECKWKKPAGPKEVKSAQDLFPTSRSYDPLSRPVTDGDRQWLWHVLRKQCLDGVMAVQWGVANEREGVKALQSVTGITMQESGLWLSPSGILGASPDGLVGDNALVEVKCPYRERDMTISAAAQSPGFCLKEGATCCQRATSTGTKCRGSCTSQGKTSAISQCGQPKTP
ncbi:hypothetical protein SKAU_G00018650 [Synaphobranchus kaupii]|uniref:YqaJ viral recombinase domain-containing protein n=1 Tax=Synaphobranchus kaupii TaxID=118154 RepID=A0A9Q1JE39_SYNKA|nr:hypothetical protein SKAU_G00018650 [Synaphobranchus kaupii]